jgi:hypothetical protein
MISMRLEYKITNIRPKHNKKVFYFLVHKFIHRFCLKLGDEYLMLGPLLFRPSLYNNIRMYVTYVEILAKHFPLLMLCSVTTGAL